MRDGGREEEDGDSRVLSLIKQWLISGVERHSLALGVNMREGLDGLVASMAPLPADKVGQEHNEDQTSQGCTNDDWDQHVIFIQLALLS